MLDLALIRDVTVSKPRCGCRRRRASRRPARTPRPRIIDQQERAQQRGVAVIIEKSEVPGIRRRPNAVPVHCGYQGSSSCCFS